MPIAAAVPPAINRAQNIQIQVVLFFIFMFSILHWGKFMSELQTFLKYPEKSVFPRAGRGIVV